MYIFLVWQACRLFVSTYPRVTPAMQEDLRRLFLGLCRDETPMVRRAACQQVVASVRA